MNELLRSSYFCVALTIGAYWLGMSIQKKAKSAICNGMLLAVLMVIGVLKLTGISYEEYNAGTGIINTMLGPATCCLAVSIYTKRDLLKKNLIPVLAGCLAGVVTSFVSIMVMCKLFGLDDAMTISLLPKSVTTPIASAISASNGGVVAITVAAVIFTGIGGNLVAPLLVKLFRIKDPMAAGLGIGAASHAMGTAKAIELGETQGALSGLAIGVCGIMTAILALSFGLFF